jgi:hypothetical protein
VQGKILFAGRQLARGQEFHRFMLGLPPAIKRLEGWQTIVQDILRDPAMTVVVAPPAAAAAAAAATTTTASAPRYIYDELVAEVYRRLRLSQSRQDLSKPPVEDGITIRIDQGAFMSGDKYGVAMAARVHPSVKITILWDDQFYLKKYRSQALANGFFRTSGGTRVPLLLEYYNYLHRDRPKASTVEVEHELQNKMLKLLAEHLRPFYQRCGVAPHQMHIVKAPNSAEQRPLFKVGRSTEVVSRFLTETGMAGRSVAIDTFTGGLSTTERQAVERVYQGDREIQAAELIILLWLRRSGSNPGGAYPHLDTNKALIRQIVELVSELHPGASIWMIGDRIYKHTADRHVSASPGKQWKRHIRMEAHDLMEYWRSWKGITPTGWNLNQQLYFLNLIKHKAIAVGMRSGMLEAPAMMGMRTIWIDHYLSSGKDRIEKYSMGPLRANYRLFELDRSTKELEVTHDTIEDVKVIRRCLKAYIALARNAQELYDASEGSAHRVSGLLRRFLSRAAADVRVTVSPNAFLRQIKEKIRTRNTDGVDPAYVSLAEEITVATNSARAFSEQASRLEGHMARISPPASGGISLSPFEVRRFTPRIARELHRSMLQVAQLLRDSAACTAAAAFFTESFLALVREDRGIALSPREFLQEIKTKRRQRTPLDVKPIYIQLASRIDACQEEARRLATDAEHLEASEIKALAHLYLRAGVTLERREDVEAAQGMIDFIGPYHDRLLLRLTDVEKERFRNSFREVMVYSAMQRGMETLLALRAGLGL